MFPVALSRYEMCTFSNEARVQNLTPSNPIIRQKVQDKIKYWGGKCSSVT